MILGFAVHPLRLGRGQNDRLHRMAAAKKTAKDRAIVDLLAKAAVSPRQWPKARLHALLRDHRFVVLMIRVSPSWRPLDDDNLRGSLKAVRDAISHRLGVDDGDRRSIRFEYTQRRGEWALEFKVSIEKREE